MGTEWSALLGHVGPVGLVVGVGAAATLILRWLLIAVVVLWSLRTDEKGRKHALGLLHLLGAKHRIGLAGRPAAPEVTQDGGVGGWADAPP